MFNDIINYLANNKVALVGAVSTISELVVIIVNMYRRLKSDQKKFTILSADTTNRPSFMKHLLWSANPVNLFRKA